MKTSLIIIILLIGMTHTILFGEDVYLKITSKAPEQIKCTVIDFYNEDQNLTSKSNFVEILKKDLNYSIFLDILDSCECENGIISEVDQIDYHCLGNQNVQVVVWGKFTELNQTKGRVELYLQSVAFSQTILKRKYEGERDNLRYIAHTVADDIVKQLTGEWGIANTKILFVSDRTGNKELYMCDYDGLNITQLTDYNSITLFPDISMDNSKILFTSFIQGHPKLFLAEYPEFKHRTIAEFQGQNGPASFSPDGKKIALTLSKDGNAEIYIMDLRTKRLERITYNWGIDTSPCWSPTGKQIAFTSDVSGSPQIYTINSDGTNMKRLTYIGNYNDQSSWSPRGDQIAYCSRVDNRFNIVSISVDGTSPVLLTSEGDNQNPSWSPDGYYLTFSSNRKGIYQLYQMNYQATDLRTISFSGPDHKPVWSNRYNWKFAK